MVNHSKQQLCDNTMSVCDYVEKKIKMAVKRYWQHTWHHVPDSFPTQIWHYILVSTEEMNQTDLTKPCRHRSDATERVVRPESKLVDTHPADLDTLTGNEMGF